ncbi:3-dehydroquinate dehydratase [Campylobacter fetus subsp. testudinum]|uniref:ATP-binding protein n=1 Tax=Campylobacter fetus TaxID=196 RepID=UPI000818A0ED|nr:AAA family ATPase [Campylobacter fetus]AVK80700.1 3-dehydroquinate dehydratase [Campylobacter fetus subsp. testudinum]OCR89505.1 3-dehydroquinate dehydratase [Campylobacter fetus subsp. testudinum]OCS05393.1 3-dehydroquinate dehydratase [Campylobacter fetus subsp. testudinum]
MLEDLFMKSRDFLELNYQKYQRYFLNNNKLEHRLSIIIGPRGIGKTTVVVQYIISHYNNQNALYVNLDDLKNISKFTMTNIAEEFVLNGGKLLCFDEIHKYDNWSGELKNIYDRFPNLKVIATSSSALQIHKGSHDLSRRAIVYQMFGMSFREFLELHYGYKFDSHTLEDILTNHIEIANLLKKSIEANDNKIIPIFKDYLKFGYYPYYLSMPNETLFLQTLNQNINISIESDLLNIYPKLSGTSIRKIKMLLSAIIKNVPFTPNMSDLKKVSDIKDDRTLKEYLSKLDDTGLIKLLMQNSLNIKSMDKPEKIYLGNTNLMYVNEPNIGNLRETFFVNQLDNYYKNSNMPYKGIYASNTGDFYCEEKYTFEVGGKNKKFDQIKDVPNSFIASDDMEVGFGNKIPLWLFGFLY